MLIELLKWGAYGTGLVAIFFVGKSWRGRYLEWRGRRRRRSSDKAAGAAAAGREFHFTVLEETSDIRPASLARLLETADVWKDPPWLR